MIDSESIISLFKRHILQYFIVKQNQTAFSGRKNIKNVYQSKKWGVGSQKR